MSQEGLSSSFFNDDLNSKKANYWLAELDSLGIAVKRKNELNDEQELCSLVDNIKQMLFQEYKTAYRGEEEREKQLPPTRKTAVTAA
jgi:hypothetical protein